MKTQLSLLALALSLSAPAQQPHVNAQLTGHAPVLDAHGKLLAWYQPERNLGWDKILHLGWDFLEHHVALDTVHGTGLPIYLVNSVFDGETRQGTYWQHNPAMTFAGLVDGLMGWYPYSGDADAITLVRGMLDHQLAHGTTPAGWAWSGVPFATSCGKTADYGTCIQDMPNAFYGGIESDKVGELGTAYALFYEFTGERKYLDAATHAADALAAHVRTGDATHTPWAFRIDARTGDTLAREEYGGNITGPLRLFDELIRLKSGDTAHYAKARATAVAWLLEHPLNRESAAWNKWTGYFEDVSHNESNVNQVLPTLLARYILSSPDPAALTPHWTRWTMMTGRLLDWVRDRFARGPYLGAVAIDEQGTPDGHGCCSRAGLSSHTSRWAAVNALYWEKTGDMQAREDAFRSLNYATYFALDDGRISCCGDGFGGDFWFSDGYADYLRSYSWALGSMPEYAPLGQSHLLRSSSVVQHVEYGAHSLRYTTFDADSTEVLRLAYRPRQITADAGEVTLASTLNANSYTLEPVDKDFIVRVRHNAGRHIAIE